MSAAATNCLLCKPSNSPESLDSVERPENLRSVRLLINRGARRRPAVVPLVCWAISPDSAVTHALRLGRRIYGERFFAVASRDSAGRPVLTPA